MDSEIKKEIEKLNNLLDDYFETSERNIDNLIETVDKTFDELYEKNK